MTPRPETIALDNNEFIVGSEIPTLTLAPVLLKPILCIHFLLYFKKDNFNVKALINSDNKVNNDSYLCKKKLKFWTQKTNIDAQKIDKSSVATYKMVIAGF